jgi:hypothetical protein
MDFPAFTVYQASHSAALFKHAGLMRAGLQQQLEGAEPISDGRSVPRAAGSVASQQVNTTLGGLDAVEHRVANPGKASDPLKIDAKGKETEAPASARSQEKQVALMRVQVWVTR